MHSSSAGLSIGRATALSALASLCLLAAGCASLGTASAPKPAAAAPGVPAPVTGDQPLAAGREIACRIQMIDGKLIDGSERLRRGRHRLIVAFGEKVGEYSGDVDIFIPTTKRYLLKAERDDEIFTISLLEEDTSTVLAISAASAAPVMRFQVFVHQK